MDVCDIACLIATGLFGGKIYFVELDKIKLGR